MKKFLSIFIVLFIFLSCKKTTNENQKIEVQKTEIKSYFPKPLGYVSDYDKCFTIGQIEKLNKILSDYESKTTGYPPEYSRIS